MSKETINKEEEVIKATPNNTNKDSEKGVSAFFKSLINGTLLSKEIILKQFPFVLFLTFIAILLIGNRYGAEKVIRKTQSIENELKELKAEQISVTSELMQLSQQSEVINLINQKKLGLIESIDPPQKIIIKTNK